MIYASTFQLIGVDPAVMAPQAGAGIRGAGDANAATRFAEFEKGF
ncbi:hypothetical protein V474_19490 [Novosphingobium barchaimii LL02]|uniref:Uncharacterized protein n=1 Tax=Novosphingobium barchaimii LL02 TaxID=1114963 RepID=A0A0J7XWH8_9SPHN|nr:hypothetical protein V474_19490 [Novosphingobium barchaimii LL02]